MWHKTKLSSLHFVKGVHVRLLYSSLCQAVALFGFVLSIFSSKRSVLRTRFWQTQRRRSYMIVMENRGYEREEAEDLAWMIFSLIFLAEDFLGSWAGRAEVAMEARGEEKIWFILWSEYVTWDWVLVLQLWKFKYSTRFNKFNHFFAPTEFLLKISTMAKPLNCSSVRMCCVVLAMGGFTSTVVITKQHGA